MTRPRHLLTISFIFLCTAAAWLILSATVFSRSEASHRTQHGRVAANWGTPQEAAPPTVQFGFNGPLAGPESTHASAQLDLEYRQKGLLWYSTYRVNFAAVYRYRNPSKSAEHAIFRMPSPSVSAIYDGLEFAIDGQPLQFTVVDRLMTAFADVAAESEAMLTVTYRSQGIDAWRYKFDAGVAQVRDFHLTVRTNFAAIDFADNTLSPTSKRSVPPGWELTWDYKTMIAGDSIAVVMPERIQPGPLAGQISLFAPVSLFFFFFVLVLVTTVRRIELHPVNYFFLATAFFAFHLLLAYLVDHISIHWAVPICSLVSVFLVVNYLRLVAGFRFAAMVAGGAQLVYLILFSYAFFFQGFTGLTVTIGAIVTLFVSMQMTGRIRWAEHESHLLP